MKSWSLQQLMIYITIVAIVLGVGSSLKNLDSYAPAAAGALLLIFSVVAWAVLPTPLWRRIVYGALLGITISLVLVAIYAEIYFAEHGRTYQSSNDLTEAIWNPFVIPTAILLGATGAVLLFPIEEKISKEPQNQDVLASHESKDATKDSKSDS